MGDSFLIARQAAIAAGLVACAVLAACDQDEAPTPPSDNPSANPGQTVVRNCRSRVEGPRLKAGPSDIQVGPITFYGLADAGQAPPREFAGKRGRGPAWKAVTEVVASTQATLTISASDRDKVALIYDNFGAANGDGYKLSAGSPAVRFEACPPDTPQFSGRHTVGPRTQFNGGFIVTRPGCYPVEVRAAGGDTGTSRAVIGFGRQCS